MSYYSEAQKSCLHDKMMWSTCYAANLCYAEEKKKDKHVMHRRDYVGGRVYDIDIIVKVKKVGGPDYGK